MSARDNILSKLKLAQSARVSQPVSRPDFGAMHRAAQTTDEMLAAFTDKLQSVNGEVIRCQRAQCSTLLSDLLKQKNIRSLLSSEYLIADYFNGQAECRTLTYQQPIEAWKESLFNDVDASLTSTVGAIAETGSLVLWPNEEEPRLMSLVPPIHIAILFKADLQPTFWHFMQHHKWSERMPTNALLISGPSKTADIEQTLAYGVHGPKELIVVVVE